MRGHLQLDGQYPQQAHHCGGGSCCPTREVITIYIICFIYYFLFYANPLPSSIPPPLNLHNRQVDDCVADNEEILIEGGQVDVMAEEVEEDVGVTLLAGVVCKKYEEPESCGSAANFLLGIEMEGDPPGRMDGGGMH